MNADVAVNTTAGAFLAGLLTSVHCVGMCGPVACLLGGNRPSGPVNVACGAYHGARVFAYGLLGMVAGLLGQIPIQLLGGSGLMMLPWLLVLALLVIGTASFQDPSLSWLGSSVFACVLAGVRRWLPERSWGC